jgi:ornithine cyclodeaminase
MDVLVLSKADVARLLPLDACMNVMEETLKALSSGQATMPLRSVMPVPGGTGLLGLMPGTLGPANVFGAKITSVYGSNLNSEFESHQGVVVLFEAEHGRPLALVDAGEVTAVRTAAVSGVATRVLAREDARTLALIGSGSQAHPHLEAMLLVRPIEEVRVWSRSQEHARAFVAHEAPRWEKKRPGVRFRVVDDVAEAVYDADIVCTLTSASEPVLRGDQLPAGVHINAVGSTGQRGREIDTEVVRRARFFVDRLESTLNEAGDFLIARAEGAVGDDHILGELGDVLLGRVPGRRSLDEITLFRSLGLAVEDVATAHFLYREAREAGLGVWAPLGGLRPGAE